MPRDAPWDVRLQRADEHLAVLRRDMDVYLKSGPVELLGRDDSLNFELRIRVHQLPPAHWSAAIGDYLHNLRSALDNLTWAAVEKFKTRNLDEREARAVIFPIGTSPDGWSRLATKRLPSVRESEVLLAFRSEQPFAVTGNDAELLAAGLAERQPLAVLQSLSNIDKHRTLLLVFLVVSKADQVRFPLAQTRWFRRAEESLWQPASPGDEAVLGSVRTDGSVRLEPSYFDVRVALAINERLVKGMDLGLYLAGLGSAVRGTVHRLSRLLV